MVSKVASPKTFASEQEIHAYKKFVDLNKQDISSIRSALSEYN